MGLKLSSIPLCPRQVSAVHHMESNSRVDHVVIQSTSQPSGVIQYGVYLKWAYLRVELKLRCVLYILGSFSFY